MKINLPFRNCKEYPITQLFGERFLYRGQIVSHKGVDWAMPKFTPLLVPFSGEVYRVEKQRDWGYGRTVYIRAKDDRGQKFEALIAHCEDILVEAGSKVKIGNVVAQSGRTGFWRGKNGYHVHFGLKVNNIYVDPLNYLDINNPNQEQLFPEKMDEAKLKVFLGDYKIRKGDTLWAIAKKFYGNGAHYIDIFNANQDIIKNPNKIYPDTILRIPVLINKGI